MMYQQQQFYVACLTHMPRPLSPLTRYLDSTNNTPMRDFPAVRHLQQCIVAVSSHTQGQVFRPYAFMDFCRAICHLSPASLKVYGLRMGMEGELDDSYDAESTVFAPLKILRLKPGTITIEDADTFDVLDTVNLFDSSPEWVACFDEANDRERNSVIQAIERDTQIEFGFEMYKALLKYCQSFERSHVFKKDMALREEQYPAQKEVTENKRS